MRWDKEYISSTIFSNPHDAKVCLDKVLNSPIWPELDLASDPEETTKNKMKALMEPQDHHIVDELLEKYPTTITLIEETSNWAIKMKKKGYKIYLLTNFPIGFHEFKKRLSIMNLLDGYVCSSDIHVIKPDPKIFEYLFNKYKLNPKECLFIDDLKKNTDAALKSGMGKVITYNNIKQLEEFDN